MNDSSTGGPLTPDGELVFVGTGEIEFEGAGEIVWRGAGPPPPLDDDALDDFFQDLIKGVTALPGEFVRPRYQPKPPPIPPRETNWCAVGVVNRERDTYAAIEHDPLGDGWDRLTRHEDLELLCSFYGPHCQGFGSMLDDGLMVPQNREKLFFVDMELTSTGPLQKAPELINNEWVSRADITAYIRRKVIRYYPVRTLIRAKAELVLPPTTQTITVAP